MISVCMLLKSWAIFPCVSHSCWKITQVTRLARPQPHPCIYPNPNPARLESSLFKIWVPAQHHTILMFNLLTRVIQFNIFLTFPTTSLYRTCQNCHDYLLVINNLGIVTKTCHLVHTLDINESHHLNNNGNEKR